MQAINCLVSIKAGFLPTAVSRVARRVLNPQPLGSQTSSGKIGPADARTAQLECNSTIHSSPSFVMAEHGICMSLRESTASYQQTFLRPTGEPRKIEPPAADSGPPGKVCRRQNFVPVSQPRYQEDRLDYIPRGPPAAKTLTSPNAPIRQAAAQGRRPCHPRASQWVWSPSEDLPMLWFRMGCYCMHRAGKISRSCCKSSFWTHRRHAYGCRAALRTCRSPRLAMLESLEDYSGRSRLFLPPRHVLSRIDANTVLFTNYCTG